MTATPKPTPVIVGIPTTPGRFIDPSPQPEKREGPYAVEMREGHGGPICVLVGPGDEVELDDQPLNAYAIVANAAYLAGQQTNPHGAKFFNKGFEAGQKAQPEGDERWLAVVGQAVLQYAHSPAAVWEGPRMKSFEQAMDALTDAHHAALGSGEGGKR